MSDPVDDPQCPSRITVAPKDVVRCALYRGHPDRHSDDEHWSWGDADELDTT